MTEKSTCTLHFFVAGARTMKNMSMHKRRKNNCREQEHMVGNIMDRVRWLGTYPGARPERDSVCDSLRVPPSKGTKRFPY